MSSLIQPISIKIYFFNEFKEIVDKHISKIKCDTRNIKVNLVIQYLK